MTEVSTAIVPVLSSVTAINVFFGYWRSNARRMSAQWILAIHIPVIVGILLRLEFLRWDWLLLPAFVAAFVVGQFSGGQVRRLLGKARIELTSFLVLDAFRASVAYARSHLKRGVPRDGPHSGGPNRLGRFG